MRYRATTIVVQDPLLAQSFFGKYFGAKPLKREQFITHGHGELEEKTTGVRFLYADETEYFDLYFIQRSEPEVEEFQSLLRRIHR